MPYDKWGRTPEQAQEDNITGWLFIGALCAIIVGCLVWGFGA